MSNIVIDRVPKDRYDEVIDYIYEEFFPRECLNVGFGQNEEREESTELYTKWLDDDVSFIAIDSTTNKVIGISINFIVQKESYGPPDLENVSKRLQAILGILFSLEEGIDLFEKYQTNEGLELCFLGVHRDYEGRGIAKKLLEATIRLAEERGLKFVQSNPDHPATIHLFEKYGFETVAEARPAEFTLENGEPGFLMARPEDRVRFCVLSVSYSKKAL